MSLAQFLYDHPDVEHINLCLDSDDVGRGAVKRIAMRLGAYRVADRPPPSGKDYNDYLRTKCRLRDQAALAR